VCAHQLTHTHKTAPSTTVQIGMPVVMHGASTLQDYLGHDLRSVLGKGIHSLHSECAVLFVALNCSGDVSYLAIVFETFGIAAVNNLSVFLMAK
jgi:hypothetical protein